MNQDKPIEVFFSYAHEDEDLRNKLANHLSILERQGVISSWHDRLIPAGNKWADEIDEQLNTAQIILLLVSSDFIASDYCYGIEMKRALERHEAGEAQVIPIILRSVDWEGAPFAKLNALPKDAKPITSWDNQDDAFKDVTQSIRRVAEQYEVGRKYATVAEEVTSGSKKTLQRVSRKTVTIILFTIILIGAIIYLAVIQPELTKVQFTQTAEARHTAYGGTETTNEISTHLSESATSTPSPTPVVCPYRGFSDNQIIEKIINAEALAVNTKSMEIILDIFSADAIIHDYDPKHETIFIGPTERYQNDLFKYTGLKDVVHFDILPAGNGIDGNTATYTSGSRGFYKGVDDSVWEPIDNPSINESEYGSDHWVLEKDQYGCWRIIEFNFNASHVPFP